MAIVTHRKKAAGFHSLEGFNKEEVEIASKLGTTAVAAVKKYISKAKLRLFDDESKAYQELNQELRSGNFHAVVDRFHCTPMSLAISRYGFSAPERSLYQGTHGFCHTEG